MMFKHVLLLRGINVGGKNRLPMQSLREILLMLGYTQVSTYIQSGNAVLMSDRPLTARDEAVLCEQIVKTHGFAPQVLLLSAAVFEEALACSPFDLNSGKALHLYFLSAIPPSPNLERLTDLKQGTEDFALITRFFFLFAPEGIGRSKLAAQVEKALGVSATARNANTLNALKLYLEKLF
jgi:uncharacterized protein (DUF1697 family)